MKKIVRPENRSYDGIICPKCQSPKVIKFDRDCGKVQGCDRPSCKGCHQWVSAKEVSQAFRCLECRETWSIITRM